jgi:hypothetical protein
MTRVVRNTAAIAERGARLAWQVQVLNLTESRPSMGKAVLTYPGARPVERLTHRVRDHAQDDDGDGIIGAAQ